MESVTLGVVAFAVAIGFSVTEVLFRHRRRGLRYAVAMLVAIGLLLSTRYVVQPYFESTAAVERFPGSNQLLAAIERLEPSKRFGITRDVAPPVELLRRSMATVARHSWKSSDLTIVELAKTLVRNAQVLERQDPSACAAYLFPISDDDGVDYTRYLGKLALQHNVAALTGALESAANAIRPIPVTGGRERGMRTVKERLADRYTTTDFERFELKPSLVRGDRVFVCRLGIDVYREALELPPSQRAEVLRHLMAGYARGRMLSFAYGLGRVTTPARLIRDQAKQAIDV